jgi:hypothetical protein
MMRIKAIALVLIACLGLAVIVLGLWIFSLEIWKATDTRDWNSASLLDFLKSRRMQGFLPEEFSIWLAPSRSQGTLQQIVVSVLDWVPQWLACLSLGGFILWKAVK